MVYRYCRVFTRPVVIEVAGLPFERPRLGLTSGVSYRQDYIPGIIATRLGHQR
jgi:hypothetical protein